MPIAFYENAIPFELRLLTPDDPHTAAEHAALWPLRRSRCWWTGWAAGDAFTLADCAAAPSLFYADWVHPIAERFAHVRAFRQRLPARPSFARAVDEARPYRRHFPLGAPDRD